VSEAEPQTANRKPQTMYYVPQAVHRELYTANCAPQAVYRKPQNTHHPKKITFISK